jgi:hypothetical protein
MRAIIVSVNYADFLAVTLPAWKAILPPGTLSVATAPGDPSIELAVAHGVTPIVTDAWTRLDETCHVGGTPTFNAAYGMDVCLGLVDELIDPPEYGEVVVNINVDCYPVGAWPQDKHILPTILYGAWRYHCLTAKDFTTFQADGSLDRFPRMKNSGGRPVGYFNAWRWVKGRRFGSYPTAGKYDTNFIELYYRKRWDYFEGLSLLHLGPQAGWENWRGRSVPAWGAA